ncbi:hypothetical protein J1TS3_40200 [Siminovitchia fordii]|uniref:Uncharacterized protein n=1 Tax=Siminovitchia fordii TaxID=254759 RepID=A0ABQ4KB92_9BACI|nr:hypothetical protein J1TS3_40200 [Siminovitchia fordii]
MGFLKDYQAILTGLFLDLLNSSPCIYYNESILFNTLEGDPIVNQETITFIKHWDDCYSYYMFIFSGDYWGVFTIHRI